MFDGNAEQSRFSRLLSALLVSLPLTSLALAAVSWLRFGIDLPYWDDFRDYEDGTQGSLALSHLFTPANDTLYPVGKVFDALAFRFLDGNTIAYQLLSLLGVLGALLLLQWRLLSFVTRDRLMAASAFSLTVLMLQPDTYWGMQNIAFHQAIPLVCVLAVLDMVVRRPVLQWFHCAAVVLLGFVSGLVYISGAFAVITLAVVFLALPRLVPSAPRSSHSAGLALLLPGVATTLAQVWVIAFKQKGTHIASNPLTLPTSLDFWVYWLGKIARSLMLPAASPLLSFVISLVVVLVAGGVLLLVLRRSRTEPRLVPMTLVAVALFAIVFVYLLLIAAGRTSFRSPDIDTTLEVFAFAFLRFHFFWATLLWPWLVVLLFAQMRTRRTVLICLPLLALPALAHAGVFAHTDYFRFTNRAREEGLACMQRARRSGADMRCPQLYWMSMNKVFRSASEHGASFVRLVPWTAESSEPERPVYSVSDWQKVHIENVGWKLLGEQPGVLLAAGRDPIMTFDVGSFGACKHVTVVASLKVEQADEAQIFYLPKPKDAFDEPQSQLAPLVASPDFQKVTFKLRSESGFGPRLRFDPVMKGQAAVVNQLEVSCR